MALDGYYPQDQGGNGGDERRLSGSQDQDGGHSSYLGCDSDGYYAVAAFRSGSCDTNYPAPRRKTTRAGHERGQGSRMGVQERPAAGADEGVDVAPARDGVDRICGDVFGEEREEDRGMARRRDEGSPRVRRGGRRGGCREDEDRVGEGQDVDYSFTKAYSRGGLRGKHRHECNDIYFEAG